MPMGALRGKEQGAMGRRAAKDAPQFPARDDSERRAFGAETEPDAMRVINAYIAGWPYSRPVTRELIVHWKTLGSRYQPEEMALIYRRGKPTAFVHGEKSKATYQIHLLAMIPAAVSDGMRLIEEAEARARAAGAERLRGPTASSAIFYGGYICGREPYHSDRGIDGTDLFVQAGFRISSPEVILVAAENPVTCMRDIPPEYQVVEAQAEAEFEARAFRYAALCDGKEVAGCAARLYPGLLGSSGRPVGQIGHVGTDELHRNKGLATALTQRSLERLREWGAGEILVTTNVDNLPALKAYERAGFRRRHLVMEWEKRLS